MARRHHGNKALQACMATQEWKATKRKGKKARQEGKVRKENKTANDGWMF
jgi:hypothetical protein